jgi:hypothetical protein
VQSLQVDPGDTLERYVFAAFEEMYAAFERDRVSLPPGCLYEIRYEDLVADPVGGMRAAYEQLQLGEFDRVQSHFQKQADSMKRYRTNSYSQDPRIVSDIARRWKPFIDRYGYEVPSN